ncbi:MAG: WbqC-like family protein [Chthoniobacteraceae bacterium]|nr:WbqC-like family protein [Chthoniobacteraceae bacterium]
MTPPKVVAVLQSNYIPWKGYFDMINRVDEFILYDDMQYTRRDWRNRNKIKTAQGLQWLTIPVEQFSFTQRINETRVSELAWGEKHWRTLSLVYAKAPFFTFYKDALEPLYREPKSNYLSRINHAFLCTICGLLGIKTKISWSSDYQLTEGKTERLANLALAANATEYLSGPAARDYIEPAVFEQLGLKLSWMDYSGYPDYPQRHGPFEHGVSVLDLLFNTGPDAPRYMKCFRS